MSTVDPAAERLSSRWIQRLCEDRGPWSVGWTGAHRPGQRRWRAAGTPAPGGVVPRRSRGLRAGASRPRGRPDTAAGLSRALPCAGCRLRRPRPVRGVLRSREGRPRGRAPTGARSGPEPTPGSSRPLPWFASALASILSPCLRRPRLSVPSSLRRPLRPGFHPGGSCPWEGAGRGGPSPRSASRDHQPFERRAAPGPGRLRRGQGQGARAANAPGRARHEGDLVLEIEAREVVHLHPLSRGSKTP